MSAMAVAPDGTPLGLCGQAMWTRVEPSTVTNRKKDRRPLHEKETRYWLEVMEQTRLSFGEHAPTTWPWFQLDRGGDAGTVLLEAVGVSDHAWVTVRATHDRRVIDSDGESYLFDQLEQQAPAAFYDLHVTSAHNRTERVANMQLRFTPVALDLHIPKVAKKIAVPMWLVAVTEVDTTPDGEEPIQWRLLTTYPVENVEAAMRVVDGYSMRWRIEQFHNVWKTGACSVEDTQLRDCENIMRWARIAASVAVRILRLTYLGRTAPLAPATAELRPVEVEATILLRKPPGVKRSHVPDVGTVMLWLAELGGYTGKSSGGPPGARVIARGLLRIEPIWRSSSDRLICDQWSGPTCDPRRPPSYRRRGPRVARTPRARSAPLLTFLVEPGRRRDPERDLGGVGRLVRSNPRAGPAGRGGPARPPARLVVAGALGRADVDGGLLVAHTLAALEAHAIVRHQLVEDGDDLGAQERRPLVGARQARREVARCLLKETQARRRLLGQLRLAVAVEPSGQLRPDPQGVGALRLDGSLTSSVHLFHCT
jgi:hypothetical protein